MEFVRQYPMSFLDGIEESEGQILQEGQTINDLVAQESDSPTDNVEESGADQDKETAVKFDKEETAKRFELLTQRNKELKAERESFKAELDEIKSWKQQLEQERVSNPETTEVPDFWLGDEASWKKQQAYMAARENALIEKMEAKKQAEVRQAQETQNYWEGWVKEQIDDLEEFHGRVDRNRLQAIMVKYKPTDEEGNLDFQAGYELMQDLDTKTSNTAAKKKIADVSSSSRTSSDSGYQGIVKVF